MTPGTEVVTVYKIEAQLVEVTAFGEQQPSYLPARTLVHARGKSGDHSWPLDAQQAQPLVGAKFAIAVLEDDA